MPTDHEFNDERPVAGAAHVHDRACVNDDLHCPDRVQDLIVINTEADAEFWAQYMPMMGVQITVTPAWKGKSPIVQPAESITRTIERTNAILRDRELIPPMMIHRPEPILDVFQDRADADDTTRVEGKRRVLTETYGGDPMLVKSEVAFCGCRRGSGTPHLPSMHGTILDPGTGTAFPELAQDATDAPRSLRDILFSHRALAAATALEITELMTAVTDWAMTDRKLCSDLLTLTAARDARQQRDNARGQDQLFTPGHPHAVPVSGHREAQWLDANPGLAALLEAVDRG